VGRAGTIWEEGECPLAGSMPCSRLPEALGTFPPQSSVSLGRCPSPLDGFHSSHSDGGHEEPQEVVKEPVLQQRILMLPLVDHEQVSGLSSS
jgi:hypothetical protein